MAHLEGRRVGRERDFLLALFRAVVGDGKEQTSDDSRFVLVVELDWIVAPAGLRSAPARFGLHLRLCLHLDSLHSQPDNQPPFDAGGILLREVRNIVRAKSALLLTVRPQSG